MWMYLNPHCSKIFQRGRKIRAAASLEPRNSFLSNISKRFIAAGFINPCATLQLGSVLPFSCSIASVRITEGVEISGLLQLFSVCWQVGPGPCVQGSRDPLGVMSLCHQHAPGWRMLPTRCLALAINHCRKKLNQITGEG